MSELFQNFFTGNISWLDIFIRVAVSVLIGAVIGIERELSNHPAGIKTHALVCLGAAVTAMISSEMCFPLMNNPLLDPSSKIDMSRIASGVVSGIGFIGAGAIIKSKDGSVVTGITTAATVWISGCMGLAVGFGYFKIISIAMLAIVFTTVTLRKIENKFFKSRGIRYIEIIASSKKAALPVIEDYFDRKQIVVTSFDCKKIIEEKDEEIIKQYRCRYYLRIPKGVPFSVVMRDLARFDEVSEVYEASHREKKQ